MPLRDDLLNPIPGENPSGTNLRYDPDTDKIKEARREELDVPQGDWKTTLKTAEYPVVIKLAGELLAKRGKDLQIAVWLIDALVRAEGFAVLAPSIRFLHDLMDQFWDTLYPEIEDGDVELRAAPVEWLGSKLEEPLRRLSINSKKHTWLDYQESRLVGSEADANSYEKQEVRNAKIKEGKLSAEAFDEGFDATPVAFYEKTAAAISETFSELETISEFCDYKFGDYSPSFLKTRKALEDIEQTIKQLLSRKRGGVVPRPVPKSEPTPDPVEDEELTGYDSSPSRADEDLGSVMMFADESPSDTPSSRGESRRAAAASPLDPDELGSTLGEICRGLREKDPSDVTPFLIIRGFRWGELWCQAPPVIFHKLEAPPTDVRVELRRLTNSAEWKEVLDAAEDAMALPCGRGWLDLQRYTVAALDQLQYYSASAAVKSGLRALLQDLPDLLDANLMDDTPCANAETKAWIASFVLSTPADLPAAEPAVSEDTPSDDTSSSTDDTPAEEPSSDTPVVEEEPVKAAEPEPVFDGPIDENPPIIEASVDVPVEPEPDVFEVAKQSLQDGNTSEGLGLISKKLANERSGRARFRRRTQLAHLLMMGGHGKIAQPLLDQISLEIEERNLEQWEDAEALAYPLELLMRCLSSEEDQREKKLQLYNRICKLDPLRALTCTF